MQERRVKQLPIRARSKESCRKRQKDYFAEAILGADAINGARGGNADTGITLDKIALRTGDSLKVCLSGPRWGFPTQRRGLEHELAGLRGKRVTLCGLGVTYLARLHEELPQPCVSSRL